MSSGVSAECPHCHAVLPLKSRKTAGRQASCPQCRKAFVVRVKGEDDASAEHKSNGPTDDGQEFKPPPVMVRSRRPSPAKLQAAREREAAQQRRFFWVRLAALLIWLNANVAAAACILDGVFDFIWMLLHWDEVRAAAPMGRIAIRQLGRPLIVIITAAIIWWQGVLFRDRSARYAVMVFGGGYLLLFGIVAFIVGLVANSIYERPIYAVQWSVVYYGASLLLFAMWGYGPETTLQRAERLTSEGRYSDALTAANQALQEDPDDRDALELQRAIRDMMRYG
jgi:hypothetical protein